MGNLSEISDDELRDKIEVQGWTYREVGAYYGCSESTVGCRCKRVGIKVKRLKNKDKVTQESLYQKIVVEGKSYSQAAREFDVGRNIIVRRCIKYKIEPIIKFRFVDIKENELRYKIESERKTIKQAAKEFDCSVYTIIQRCKQYNIKKQFSVKTTLTEELLKRLILEEKRNIEEIASLLECTTNTIKKYCRKYDIYYENKTVSKTKYVCVDTLRTKIEIDGISYKEASEYFGCYTNKISDLCYENGIAKKQKRFRDYTGEVFGPYEVLSFHHYKNKSYWNCRCLCGVEEVKNINFLKRIKEDTFCRGKHKTENYEGIAGSLISSIIRNAANRGHAFLIPINELWETWIKQEGKCALSGVEIVIPSTNQDYYDGKYSASLDRIDSSLHYCSGNVQWVHKKINYMKGNMTEEEFLYWCDAISDNRKGCDDNTTNPD